jgi:hypothetical protein
MDQPDSCDPRISSLQRGTGGTRPTSYDLHIQARRERAEETAKLFAAAARLLHRLVSPIQRGRGLAHGQPRLQAPGSSGAGTKMGGAAAPPVLVTDRM